ncbi:MAG: twin-arginine translocase TatA/TatE family subunit [Clostridiales bacterium]|nr:twin-arginine translocase TatA/TatE family subunit [Clostridiales bacterium]
MKIGMTEILLILVVALFVAGPDKLPYYARKFGEALRSFRDISSEAAKEIKDNVVEPLNEAQAPLREAMKPATDLASEVSGNIKDVQKSFSDLGKPLKAETDRKKSSESAKDSKNESKSGTAKGGESKSDSEPGTVKNNESTNESEPEPVSSDTNEGETTPQDKTTDDQSASDESTGGQAVSES